MGFRDTGYYSFYFQGYRILSILLQGIYNTMFNICVTSCDIEYDKKINNGDVLQFIRDTCLFISIDMRYLVPLYKPL